MAVTDQFITAREKARAMIKQNRPELARKYVVKMLNIALQSYQSANTVEEKSKTEDLINCWIEVADDLWLHGITENVLERFGLSAHAAEDMPTTVTPSPRVPFRGESKEKESDAPRTVSSCGDNMKTQGQGWCADIFEINKTAVVEILIQTTFYTSSGTGFVISMNGYLLTNAHVVCKPDSGGYYSNIWMKLSGETEGCPLKVVESDKEADIALCKFDPNAIRGLTCVKCIKDYTTLRQGADCLVIGNAFGQGLAPFSGVIRFTENDEGDLVYTAPSNPGDSGGPVINRYGEVIGINKSTTVTFDGRVAHDYANATPMPVIDQWLEKWTKKHGITL